MDFEATIRSALADGKSAEDVAKYVTETLNKIQKENSIKSKEAAREVYVDACWARLVGFWESDKATPTMNDVLDMLIAAVEESHPEWSPEDMEDLRKSAKTSLEFLVKTAGKGTSGMIDEFSKEVKDKLGRDSWFTKDWDAISKFLRNL